MISLRARTIAIVGAGPSGVIAAKYLQAEKAFDKIVLFEQRSRPGGIWNYTGDQRDENLFSIPQTNPHLGHQKPHWEPVSSGETSTNNTHEDPSFLSPMYEKLETNIPRGLMGFQDLDWPKESQLFPTHETVLKYIEDYGKDVQHLVQYETQVINVIPVDSSPTGAWKVTTQNVRSAESQESEFDAVIVANGHFIVPYVPDIPGMREWNEEYPNRIIHSKYFRRPEEYRDKQVIVVGNSASGADISNQIAQYCEKPLIWSTRSDSMFSKSHGGNDKRRQELSPIARFLPASRGVQFEDGTIKHDIDAIVFATGYFYSLPFLEDVEPKLITDGTHVHNTYKHLFHAPRPTLSLLALNQRVIPFPLAEAQAAVLARVYAGRLSLPSVAEMSAWEKPVEQEISDPRNFHLLPFPKDAHYINEMSRWALSAEKLDVLENDGQGKIPPIWGDWEFWCREQFPAIRMAFGKLGCYRFQVKEIGELGFDYEEHLRQKEREKEGAVEDGEKMI
ncbi:FAD/NAD(P)-binding domain-containing protein [Cucurbitaria berberidis CBS 394.84]|uniref:FAD/NAD(P)-binding domain-containing protein n=1 Tax=Cucurbitaria berberidis CBS 394.84 TaxID=1168544 RepID=A0A9P4GM56_9PLEO|nr:FAD/NAD(P)-binding domain-containing protein [Cucurbitaria berberidis CBS 394.84]KAF1848115.1 FAD/NAD(P)-binding domain-containing protein [Cucurbitaria berberidis CBS 394.84]